MMIRSIGAYSNPYLKSRVSFGGQDGCPCENPNCRGRVFKDGKPTEYHKVWTPGNGGDDAPHEEEALINPPQQPKGQAKGGGKSDGRIPSTRAGVDERINY